MLSIDIKRNAFPQESVAPRFSHRIYFPRAMKLRENLYQMEVYRPSIFNTN